MNTEAKKEARTGLKVTTGLKGGRIAGNHNRQLKVTTGLRGGRLAGNHNRTPKVMTALCVDK